MEDEFARMVEEAAAQSPRVAGVDWGMALAISILRVLESRSPGFRDEVRERIRTSARSMESSADDDMRADAPSMFDLADAWIFTE